MNPNNIQNEVEHLRAEMPREGAKGELIYSLTRTKGQKMNTLRKATLPTLVTAVALVGGVMLMQPKAVAATPKAVAAALKKAMNYTIQSFVGEGAARRMQSVTTVEGDKKMTKFVDSKGNLVDQDVHFKTLMGKDGSVTVTGKPIHMGEGMTMVPDGGKVVKGEKIEVNVTKINGKETKTIKVNGKEVKELPKELQDKIKVSSGGAGTKVVAGMGIVGDMPKSALEVGPNLGLNLQGIQALAPMDLWGIEPNPAARTRLVEDGILPQDRVIEGFGHKIPLADGAVEMAFTSGVLIHVDPSLLEQTMSEIHRVSSKYVFCAEYFSPKAETITYRGETDLLFKNDFGSLYLDNFPDLVLVDYGFFWRRTTVMDDSTWWLFRKA